MCLAAQSSPPSVESLLSVILGVYIMGCFHSVFEVSSSGWTVGLLSL